MVEFTPQDYPILEFDPTPEALIEPSRLVQPKPVPECCVICFFQEAIRRACEEQEATPLHECRAEDGPHPLYRLTLDGRPFALFHPGVGAPLAVGLLEEVIALGCRRFIVCGGAGRLARELTSGHIIVPTAAVRDEGTSYHYMPPSREVAPHPAGVAAIERTLRAHQVPYLLGKTWTTDAFYRETPAKIARRKEEGCITVEMEASAFFALARFRGIILAQMLYGGDDVSGPEWDSAGWHTQTTTREKLLWLAAEACLSIETTDEH